jgi:hypothetical protein
MTPTPRRSGSALYAVPNPTHERDGGNPLTLRPPDNPHNLRPGPGLTVVCGRNGSGKSSFAEALEVVVAGGVRRLRGRSEVWRTG